MADKKISALTSATTPLTGAEEVPMVQSGTTKKSTVNDINLCKAWVKFRGTDSFIFGSYNVSSITRSAAGVYTINFTNALPDANYAVIVTPNQQGGVTLATMGSGASNDATKADVYTSNYLGASFDPSVVSVAIFR